MSNKDYRELQISSSQLVIIFLAIIILGVIIFLLGISVGKKQAQIVLSSRTETPSSTESLAQKKAIPVDEPEEQVTQSRTPAEKKSSPQKTPAETKTQALVWFIQVGAFQNSQGAQSVARKFREEGYNAIVLNPTSSDRSTLYRVRIGGYATKDLAESAKAEMMSKNPEAAEYLVIRQR